MTDAGESSPSAASGELLVPRRRGRHIRLWVARAATGGEDVPCLHGGEPVTDIAFAPDGALLASTDSSEVVTLWALDGDRSVGPRRASTSALETVAFCLDGDTLAAGGRDGSVGFWDVDRRTRWVASRTRRGSRGRLVQPGRRALAAGTDNGTIRLWDDILWRDVAAARGRVCRLVGRNLTRAEWEELLPGEDYRKTCDQWPAG